MTIRVHYIHPQATWDHVGFVPEFLSENDPRPVREQFHERYAFGGGWHPVDGFTRIHPYTLKYPGDPPLQPLAFIQFRKETILIYPASFIAIFQEDGTFECARMD